MKVGSASPNTVHLNYPDGLFDIHFDGRTVGSTAEREVAHLAFDAARISSIAAGNRAFLKDLVEDGGMKGAPLPRGEWRPNGGVCGG